MILKSFQMEAGILFRPYSHASQLDVDTSHCCDASRIDQPHESRSARISEASGGCGFVCEGLFPIGGLYY